MPTYEYRCDEGHTFELVQRMSEDALDTCEICGAPARRVLHPVAVHFKGKGFYNTDYGTRKRQAELKDSAEKGADSNDSKVKDKKEPSTSSSSSSDGSSSSSGSGSGGGSGGSDSKPAPAKSADSS